jgi:hypothetical protein
MKTTNLATIATPKQDMPYNLVWYVTFDDDYWVEIHRTDESYKGLLHIFKHTNNYECIYTSPVVLSFDAKFGPDVYDVRKWCVEIENFIDNEYEI